MPLIILGLIVVLGVALLIYYQLGPKVTLRLKSGKGGMFGSGGFGGYSEGDAPDSDLNAEENTDSADANNTGAGGGDGKVLFIFGGGEREERPINEDDEKDKE